MKEKEFIIPNETSCTAYQEHMGRYIFASRFVKDKIVLDLACGAGYGSSYLYQKGAKIVVGGDYSSLAIEHAKAHYAQQDGLFFIRFDATQLPFKDEVFDVIASFETIEHLRAYNPSSPL